MTSPTNPANFSRLQLAARGYARALADACECFPPDAQNPLPADPGGYRLALDRARHWHSLLLDAARLASQKGKP